MEENVFDNEASVPDETSVLDALGPAADLWVGIKEEFEKEYGPAIKGWKYYGEKTGWTLRFVSMRGGQFFFNAMRGGFRLSFNLGEKALAAALGSNLPEEVTEAIRKSAMQPGGGGVHIVVKDEEMAAVVKKLLRIKMDG